MKIALLMASLAMIAGQASALSCLRPDPVTTFLQLDAAPERYFVIYGRLQFDESALSPDVARNQTRTLAPIPARFTGKSLTRAGFVKEYTNDVLLQIGCIGQWCGTARSDVDAVIFVAATDRPVTIRADACNDRIFEEPSQAVLDRLTQCMQGGPCSPQPLQ